MKNKLKDIINRYDELTNLLTKQEIINNKDKFKEIAKEHNSLIEIHQLALVFSDKDNQLDEDIDLLGQPLSLRQLQIRAQDRCFEN